MSELKNMLTRIEETRSLWTIATKGVPQPDDDKLMYWCGRFSESEIEHAMMRLGTGLQYNPNEAGGAKQLLYDFLSPEVKNLPPSKWQMKFRANWSLRDVEPEVNLYVKTLSDEELEEEPA